MKCMGCNIYQHFFLYERTRSAAVLMLTNYKMLPCEPLHDEGHIVNLYEEIPYHAHENEKSLIKQVIHQSLEEKSCKRCRL